MQSATMLVDGVEIDVSTDRMRDKATYQTAQNPIAIFQDVYGHRPDQHEELADIYGAAGVERATNVGE